MAQDNPIKRPSAAPIDRSNRHPKQPAPLDDRSADDDPEESGSDNDATVCETSSFGADMSDASSNSQDPSSSSNAVKL